jgi:hypothetical protein
MLPRGPSPTVTIALGSRPGRRYRRAPAPALLRRPRTSRSAAMHRPRILLLALALAAVRPAVAQDAAAAPAPPAGKPARPAIYDEQADAHQQIATALLHAKKENRRVLIQWGGNWCGWCHLLHELCASDEQLKNKLLYEYDVVLVDIGHMDVLRRGPQGQRRALPHHPRRRRQGAREPGDGRARDGRQGQARP